MAFHICVAVLMLGFCRDSTALGQDEAESGDGHNMQAGVTRFVPQTKPPPKASGSIAFRKRVNWVLNPSSDGKLDYWTAIGSDAQVSTTETDSNPFIGLRKETQLYQDICLTAQTDRVILVIARAYSERFNPQGDVTGYPTITGDWMNMTKLPPKMYGHLEADSLTLRPKRANDWGVIMGIFQVPKKATHLRLYLQVARGLAEPGETLVGFDDVGLYFCPTVDAARQLSIKFTEATIALPR